MCGGVCLFYHRRHAALLLLVLVVILDALGDEVRQGRRRVRQRRELGGDLSVPVPLVPEG